MATGSGKKKGAAGQSMGPQGRKIQGPSRGEPQAVVPPVNLVMDFDKVVEPAQTNGLDVVGGRSNGPDDNPPSARHRSRSRGPKKDQAANSVRKKIGKSKRSLSCNTRPLGVSEFLD